MGALISEAMFLVNNLICGIFVLWKILLEAYVFIALNLVLLYLGDYFISNVHNCGVQDRLSKSLSISAQCDLHEYDGLERLHLHTVPLSRSLYKGGSREDVPLLK